MAPASLSALVCVGGGRQIKARGDGISAPWLERKRNWAVDAKRMIRKEGSGVWGRRWARRTDLELVNASSPLFFQRVATPRGDEAWSCGN